MPSRSSSRSCWISTFSLIPRPHASARRKRRGSTLRAHRISVLHLPPTTSTVWNRTASRAHGLVRDGAVPAVSVDEAAVVGTGFGRAVAACRLASRFEATHGPTITTAAPSEQNQSLQRPRAVLHPIHSRHRQRTSDERVPRDGAPSATAAPADGDRRAMTGEVVEPPPAFVLDVFGNPVVLPDEAAGSGGT